MALHSTPAMRAYAAGVRSNTPVLWWGQPGEGKSAKIESHGAKWGRLVKTVVGSVREASDYLGLPIEDDGRVVYSPPAWAVELNAADAGLLFLDELTTAAPSVQKAMLRILQERYTGDYRLADSVAIVAAANPPECAADGWDLPAPVANRLMHLDWQFDLDEWFEGLGTGFENLAVHSLDDMLGNGDDNDHARTYGLITGFLRTRPDLVKPGAPKDPTEAGMAWPSPRSWTNAINVLAHLDPSDEEAAILVVKGCVGEGAAKEFFAWVATADLHDPAEVMKNPNIVKWSKERPDRLFALTYAITALALNRGDAKSWEQAMRALTVCGQNARPDVALPGVKTLMEKMPKDVKGIPTETRETFADIFQRTGRWAAA
ncbi:MoxR family ATPase [Nocardioides pakistanensis]